MRSMLILGSNIAKTVKIRENVLPQDTLWAYCVPDNECNAKIQPISDSSMFKHTKNDNMLIIHHVWNFAILQGRWAGFPNLVLWRSDVTLYKCDIINSDVGFNELTT